MSYQIIVLLLCAVINNTENLKIDKLSEQIGTWTREPKVLEFLPDNLFDYIDGDADRYLPYNFQKLIVLFYKNNTQPENDIEIQIYQMATHLDAFGIYSVHRDRNKDIFPLGKDGFIGDNQAMFYQAQYFVKLMTKKKENAKTNLELFGKEISKILPKTEEPISELLCLEQSNMVPRSECFLAKDVLAQSFFPRGTTALYKIADKTATGFIIMFKDDAEIKKGWDEYKNYLEEIGAKYQLQENEVVVSSPASETAVVSLLKKHIIGVWMPDGDVSELKKILSNIKSCLLQKTKLTETDKAEK